MSTNGLIVNGSCKFNSINETIVHGELMVLLLMVSVQMALGSSIAVAALWLMVGELTVLLLMVSVQMALGSSIAAAALWLVS